MSFYSIAPFIKQNYPEYYSIERYPADRCICIRKVKDDWGIFCNFAHTPLIVNGVQFKSAEQLFQVMKFTDAEPIRAVYQAANPKFTAKHWEKTHRREDWGSIVVDAMKFCLSTKYQQSQIFRDTLQQTGDAIIVEDQTTFPKKNADTWGAKLVNNEYVGPNLLGRLLMDLRNNGYLEYTLPSDIFLFTDYILMCSFYKE